MRRLHVPSGAVVVLDAEGTAHRFRLRVRPDGAVRARADPGERPLRPNRYLLAVDPALPYRRRLPTLPRSRRQLRLIAQDLFPFDPDTTFYAATEAGSEAQCWALPGEMYDRLIGELPPPAAAIVAQPRADRVTAAVAGRLRHAVADFLERPAFLMPVAPAVTAGLAGLCLVMAIAAYGHWQSVRQEQLQALERELDRLKETTAPLQRKRDALVRMNAQRRALAQLGEAPGVTALRKLYGLLDAMPENAHVDEIIYTDGRMRVSGLSNDAQAWAEAAGIPAERLDIARRPKVDRFTFNLPVPESPDGAETGTGRTAEGGN